MRTLSFKPLFSVLFFIVTVSVSGYALSAPRALKVRPGEWAFYDTQGKAYQLQKVIKVNSREMVVEYSTIIKDMFGRAKVISKSETVLPRYSAQAGSASKISSTSKDFIRIKDKMIECTVVTYPGGMTNWISTDIPVSGLVKSVKDGKVLMQLIDYGKQ